MTNEIFFPSTENEKLSGELYVLRTDFHFPSTEIFFRRTFFLKTCFYWAQLFIGVNNFVLFQTLTYQKAATTDIQYQQTRDGRYPDKFLYHLLLTTEKITKNLLLTTEKITKNCFCGQQIIFFRWNIQRIIFFCWNISVRGTLTSPDGFFG